SPGVTCARSATPPPRLVHASAPSSTCRPDRNRSVPRAGSAGSGTPAAASMIPSKGYNQWPTMSSRGDAAYGAPICSGRIVGPTGVAHAGGQHPVLLAQEVFHAPEAAAGEHRGLRLVVHATRVHATSPSGVGVFAPPNRRAYSPYPVA